MQQFILPRSGSSGKTEKLPRLGNAPVQRRAATEQGQHLLSASPDLTALAVGTALRFARFTFPA
ncbi:hypothetical protein [Ktedonobacter robiniae]|uniref:hypothetical protein n=1 Tax=Ktedonobacter robiniae TaxID=2778365 RepID=UPI001916392D|nr:hypothetical protein [Ktedonobacter robiniae]